MNVMKVEYLGRTVPYECKVKHKYMESLKIFHLNPSQKIPNKSKTGTFIV